MHYFNEWQQMYTNQTHLLDTKKVIGKNSFLLAAILYDYTTKHSNVFHL